MFVDLQEGLCVTILVNNKMLCLNKVKSFGRLPVSTPSATLFPYFFCYLFNHHSYRH